MKHQIQETWVNAEVIMKLTGFDKIDMWRLRRDNPYLWKQNKGKKSYKYNVSALPESMIKKETV